MRGHSLLSHTLSVSNLSVGFMCFFHATSCSYVIEMMCIYKRERKVSNSMQFVTINLQDRNTDVLDVKLLCALIQLHS